MENDEKTYFQPGDIVKLRVEMDNMPEKMLVVGKKELMIKKEGSKSFLGITCRWFTKNGELQESYFNTKDLILVKNHD